METTEIFSASRIPKDQIWVLYVLSDKNSNLIGISFPGLIALANILKLRSCKIYGNEEHLPWNMANELSCDSTHPLPKSKRVPCERARSVAHKQPFVRAVFLSAINYMGILAAVTTVVVFMLHPTRLATQALIACLFFIGITWLLAFFKRRSAHCPLCKGTPLINTGALAHQKATKIWPFNHGVSATLSIIATQTFRCMYCGTAFDLMKTPSHLAGKDETKYSEGYTAYTKDEPS